jgi:hypothetical protein
MLRCHRASRPRSVLVSSCRVADDIPHSSNGLNEPRLARQLDFISQVIDEHVDDVGQTIPAEAPHMLGDHLARERLAGMPHEVLEQLEFFAGELDAAVTALDDSGDRIEVEVDILAVRSTAGEVQLVCACGNGD